MNEYFSTPYLYMAGVAGVAPQKDDLPFSRGEAAWEGAVWVQWIYTAPASGVDAVSPMAWATVGLCVLPSGGLAWLPGCDPVEVGRELEERVRAGMFD